MQSKLCSHKVTGNASEVQEDGFIFLSMLETSKSETGEYVKDSEGERKETEASLIVRKHFEHLNIMIYRSDNVINCVE